MARTHPRDEGGDLHPYVSAWHGGWLADRPDERWAGVRGSLVFADVSGFTPLAERLARRGKVGAEELTDTLNTVFSELLVVAGRFGGDCLKFGGDALLLLFTGSSHERRAAAAAHGMQRALRRLRRQRSGAGLAKLNISMGVHSGTVHGFLVGSSHRELVLAGPGVSRTLELEAAADAGQIRVDDGTAAALDLDDVEELDTAGLVVRRAPTAALHPLGAPPAGAVDVGVPLTLREHLDGSRQVGEHRLANVAFVKVGGLDEELERRGPDGLWQALDEVIGLVQSACDEHGVTFLATDVDQGSTKVILATGVPSASPDDEDRLLVAVQHVVEAARGSHLPLRAGVHRGRIFAVDLGSVGRRTFTVMGDAVNLAARVMGQAEWGQVVATSDALERRRTDFELAELPPFMVKGKSQPVHASVVGAPRGVRRGQEAVVPLVGREAEAAAIDALFADARAGRGRIIELVGEPGIGKSKLVATLANGDHGLTRLAFEAGRYSLATPYFALRRGMREAMGLTLETPAADVVAGLLELVEGSAPELIPWLPLLAVPLGVELPETPETADLDPANRNAALHVAVSGLLRKVLATPTLITIEDAHWLDGASCDLLRALFADVAERPWAVLVTRRHVSGGLELDDGPAIDRRRIEPLGPEALVALARAAAGDAALPPGTLQELVARCGGNPLFLQELVDASVRGALSELPETIEAVVAASIDTLPARDRALLRHAAVLGGHLPLPVLAAMVDEPLDEVERRVDGLAHFLLPVPNHHLRFRHILLRDVAYAGLPFRARRALHERAGEILESSTDQPEAMAELLSIHFHRAGRFDASWRYSCVAGERAQRNGAPIEAAAFFSEALEAARHLEDVTAADRASVAERLGDTCELGGRYGQSTAAYRQARRLAGSDPTHQARLCRKIGYVRDHEGRYVAAQRWFRRGLSLLEPAGDARAARGLRAELITATVSSKIRQGRHARAEPLVRAAIREAQAGADRAALAHAYFVYDQLLCDQGRYAEARHSEDAAQIYEALGDHRGAAAAHNEVGNTAYWLGRWDAAVASYERAMEADRRAGALVYNAIYLNNIGEIRSDQGRLGEAESLLSEAHALWTGGGWRVGSGWALSNLGRVSARAGRFDEAAQRLSEAGALFAELGAETMLVENHARDLERLVLSADAPAALALVDEVRAEARRLSQVSVIDLVTRLEGLALAQVGRTEEAIACIEQSLGSSRARGVEFETALCLDALGRVGAHSAVVDVEACLAEAAAVFGRLGVTLTPAVPGLGP